MLNRSQNFQFDDATYSTSDSNQHLLWDRKEVHKPVQAKNAYSSKVRLEMDWPIDPLSDVQRALLEDYQRLAAIERIVSYTRGAKDVTAAKGMLWHNHET